MSGHPLSDFPLPRWFFRPFRAGEPKTVAHIPARPIARPARTNTDDEENMRADSALSHLHDDELCVAILVDGDQREVRWSRHDWCFLQESADGPTVLPFEDIKEWRPASIRP
jgi:hypothetical protein